MEFPLKDYPDFHWGIYSEVVNAYLATQAVVENDTIVEQIGDSYEELLNWLCLALGKKMLFLENITPGTADADVEETDSTIYTTTIDVWTLTSVFTIAAEDMLYASIKEAQAEIQGGALGFRYYYRWTLQKEGEDEETFLEGELYTENANYVLYEWPVDPPEIKQIDKDVVIRAYYKVTEHGPGKIRNNSFTYDKLLPDIDYRILTYAYKDGIDYSEAADSLAAGASIRIVVSDVYAQLTAEAKSAVVGIDANLQLDYIGVSL